MSTTYTSFEAFIPAMHIASTPDWIKVLSEGDVQYTIESCGGVTFVVDTDDGYYYFVLFSKMSRKRQSYLSYLIRSHVRENKISLTELGKYSSGDCSPEPEIGDYRDFLASITNTELGTWIGKQQAGIPLFDDDIWWMKSRYDGIPTLVLMEVMASRLR
jgi:hypothetical protein